MAIKSRRDQTCLMVSQSSRYPKGLPCGNSIQSRSRRDPTSITILTPWCARPRRGRTSTPINSLYRNVRCRWHRLPRDVGVPINVISLRDNWRDPNGRHYTGLWSGLKWITLQ